MKKVFLILSLFLAGGFVQAQDRINWLSIEELEAAQAEEPRKVFIDLYTDWCGWCKRMDKTTFEHPGIAAYINENYYAVKLNAETRDTLHFLGSDFAYVANGRKGYNELAVALTNGKLSYPTIVYMDENLKVIQPVPGYMDAKSFEQIITYLAGNHHQEQPFDQYKQNYQVVLSKN